MNAKKFTIAGSLIFILISTLGTTQQSPEQANKMGPREQYLMDRDAEIVLARSATPPSIPRDATVKAAGAAKPAAGPTAESALAADDELTKALRDDDPDGIARLLSDDWVVISARGEVGEGKSIFPNAIKSGRLKHTAYESSEPRVRVYGNVALVTTRLHNAGSSLVGSEHKPYDAMEIQTDVWLWKDGGWKCVLTHEAWEGAEKDQKLLNR
jgi:ketosteroid isomerase-like protein